MTVKEIRMAYWVIEQCETCFGIGLDPANPETICPDCRGLDVAPLKIDGLALMGGGDYRQKFSTRKETITAIDPWYA